MNWLDPQSVVNAFGSFAPWVVAAFVFIETAFIVTSFLPGDSMLFILGLTLATSTTANLPFLVAVVVVLIAAALGSQLGYEVGLRVGYPLFERNHNIIFNPKVVERTHSLFERQGARAVILARFVPIIRALVPMLAGISQMGRLKFWRYNLVGAAIWVVGFMSFGYFAGNVPFIRGHLETAVLTIVVLSSLPFPIELLKQWLQARAKNS